MAKALKIGKKKKLALSLSCPEAKSTVLHPHRKSTQIFLGQENKYVCSISASCMSHLRRGSWVPICWFLVGFLLFYAVAVCHLKRHCQVFLARACDWISKSSLAALLSLTVSSPHTQTLLNLDSEMTHGFILFTGVCLPSLGFGRVWAHSCFLDSF